MRLNVLQGNLSENIAAVSTVRSHKTGFHCFSGCRTRDFHQYLHSISTKRPRRLPLATRRASHDSTLLYPGVPTLLYPGVPDVRRMTRHCCKRCTVYGLGLLSRTVGTTWHSHDQHNTIGSRKGVESIGGRGCERCPAACAPPIGSQSPLLKKSGRRRQKQQQEPRMREASLCRVDAWRGGRR
jgi:hypothetical protein